MIKYSHYFQGSQIFSSEPQRLFFDLPSNTPQQTLEALKPVTKETGKIEKVDVEAYQKEKQQKMETLKTAFQGKLPVSLESQFRDLDLHLQVFQQTDGYLDRLGSLVQRMESSLSAVETELNSTDSKLLDQLKELQAKNTPNEIIAFKLEMSHVDALSQSPEGRAFLWNFFVVNGEVDFYGNDELERKVGLGEVTPKEQEYLLVNGRPAKKVEGLRNYYEDMNGKYVKIFDGYKVQVPTTEEIAQNKDAWKFPSEGKNIREEQLANLRASNPDMADRIQNNEGIPKEDFLGLMKGQSKYEENTPSDREFIKQRNEQIAEEIRKGGFEIPEMTGDKKKDFMNVISPIAKVVGEKYGIPWQAIALQGALESGFNLRAKTLHGIKGSGFTAFTTEVVNGKEVRIQDSFRDYGGSNLTERLINSCVGYSRFMLENKRYKPAVDIYHSTGDSVQFLEKVAQAGYATDPRYVQKLQQIASSFGIEMQNAKV